MFLLEDKFIFFSFFSLARKHKNYMVTILTILRTPFKNHIGTKLKEKVRKDMIVLQDDAQYHIAAHMC